MAYGIVVGIAVGLSKLLSSEHQTYTYTLAVSDKENKNVVL